MRTEVQAVAFNALEVRHIQKRFADVVALQDVSFEVAAGEVVALLGPSGCGKSTLLRMVAGLERQFGGRVLVDGESVAGPSTKVGVMFQEPRLMPWLTVAENIGFGLRGKVDQDDLTSLIQQVGLAGFEQALPKQLSGGMAQRVAIARGLITRPSLLLLDEPFSAVDAFTRMHLQELLLEVVNRRGATILLVTHDVDEALYLSDRVIVMSPRPGRIETTVQVPLPRPRDRRAPALAALRSDVLAALFHEVVETPKQVAFSPWF